MAISSDGTALAASNTPPSSGPLLAPGQSAFNPISAPTFGTTSTKQPAASPTTVVSSSTAADKVNNTIVPTMNSATTAIANQSASKQGTTTKNPDGSYTYSAPGYVPPTQTPTPPPAPTSTPEQDIANTPDAGYQFAYAPDGSRIQVAQGQQLPQGYASTNPTVAPTTPITASASMTTGTVVNQYNDGTYGFIGPDGKYQGVATAQDFQNAQTANSLQQNILKLTNGTYPLTPTQQAQVDGIKAAFQELITQQETANKNFTGGTTVAENLYGMGNTLTGLGEIKGTVDAGIAKIADLNSKMVSAVAQMTQAFQDENLKMLQTAYDIFNGAQKDRQTEIDKLHDAATAAAKDARDYTLKLQAQQDTEANNLRTYNLEVQKEADTLAQNAITNKREDSLAASTIAKNNADIEQIKEAQIGTIDLPGGTVTDVNGNIDPAKQAQFLQNIAAKNPGLALAIKAAANYQLDPTKFASMKTNARQAFMEQVLQYNPNFDQQQYQTRHALISNFASGTYSQQVNALNTASGHIATVASAVAGLGNINFTPYNWAKNTFGPMIGLNSTAGANLDLAAVTGELATAFKKSGATDAEIAHLGTLNDNSTPNDIKSYVSNATSLMASKLGALNDTYVSGVGQQPSSPLLHPEAIQALSGLKNQGYDINIPGVDYTDPQAYITHDPNASANMDTARNLLKQSGQPVTPENILQVAQHLQ